MKDLSTISTDLFNKIRSQFSDIKLGDENGALTDEEDNARFFDFNFKVGSEVLGRVNVKLDQKSLTVIYTADMLDDIDVGKTEWFNFLKDLRRFARSNILNFDTRDITKSNLDKRDYKYLSKESGENKMSESRLFGTSKTSFQDMGEAKIIVRHSQPVNMENPAGRTQRIESIYIESANGERFRYPTRHLNGARAMATHVANGGNPYDAIGGYITGLSEEIGKLRQFKNYTSRSGVMAEALNDVTTQVIERIDQIKTEIAALQRPAYYESFRESFSPAENIDVPEDLMQTWVDALTVKTFNEELTDVFPYLYRLVKEKQEQGLTYDDLVSEAATCDVCHKDPCECDVEESSDMFDEFESQIDELATPEFEQEEESMPAMQAEQQAIPQEVVEFIASMYDRTTGTFPRGEEGVKIACEKKFGQQAGQFANYVVEKLSMKGEGAPIATTPGSTDPGGAVDNFKQQMANNTEIKFQRQQQGVEEGSCNMTEAGEMCEVHGMEDCSMKEGDGDPQITPGMKTKYGTVDSVNTKKNTVTIKTSNGELTTMNIHDIDQTMGESTINEGLMDMIKAKILPKVMQVVGAENQDDIANKVKQITGGNFAINKDNAIKVATAFGFDQIVNKKGKTEMAEALAGNWQGKMVQLLYTMGLGGAAIGASAMWGTVGGSFMAIIGTILLMFAATFFSSDRGMVGAMGKDGRKGFDTGESINPELARIKELMKY